MELVRRILSRPGGISKPYSAAGRDARIARAGFYVVLSVLLPAVMIVGGCSFSEVNESTPPPPAPGEKVVLVDLTGKEWDITTAVWKYGLDVEGFEYGLGPMAIKPIIEPEMLSPGNVGYPPDNATFLVVGTTVNGDTRAYDIFGIFRNEVVDDYVGEAPLAVTY